MFVVFMSLKTSSMLHDTLSFPCDCYICPFTGSLAGESSFQRKVTVSQTQLQLSKLLSNLIIILHQITKKTNNTKHMAIKVMAKKQNKKLPLPFSYLSPTVPSFSTLCVCSQCPNAGESLIINTVKNVTATLLYVVQNGSDRLSFLWSQIFNPFFCREKSF